MTLLPRRRVYPEQRGRLRSRGHLPRHNALLRAFFSCADWRVLRRTPQHELSETWGGARRLYLNRPRRFVNRSYHFGCDYRRAINKFVWKIDVGSSAATCFKWQVMNVNLNRNLGMLLLAIFLIVYGIATALTVAIPTVLLGVLALAAGILILIGR
jgi:hypothetical protein